MNFNTLSVNVNNLPFFFKEKVINSNPRPSSSLVISTPSTTSTKYFSVVFRIGNCPDNAGVLCIDTYCFNMPLCSLNNSLTLVDISLI